MSVRFDQLVTGDEIWWRGAIDNKAVVTSSWHEQRPRVDIQWYSARDGEHHSTTLRWDRAEAVWFHDEEEDSDR